MKRKQAYQVAEAKDTEKLAEFLAKEGQFLLPLLEMIEQAEAAVDEVIDVAGRAAVEAILLLSAEQVAGPRHPGKRGGEVRRHGSQAGVVPLSERKVRVNKPRLRKKGGGEVPIPVYEAMQTNARLDALDILIVYLYYSAKQRFAAKHEDAQQFGGHHVLTALGVDSEGEKHVLGLAEGASENATVVKHLLEDLVGPGRVTHLFYNLKSNQCGELFDGFLDIAVKHHLVAAPGSPPRSECAVPLGG